MKITKQKLIQLLEQYPYDTIILVNGHSDSNRYEYARGIKCFMAKESYRDWDGDIDRVEPNTENSFMAIRIY